MRLTKLIRLRCPSQRVVKQQCRTVREGCLPLGPHVACQVLPVPPQAGQGLRLSCLSLPSIRIPQPGQYEYWSGSLCPQAGHMVLALASTRPVPKHMLHADFSLVMFIPFRNTERFVPGPFIFLWKFNLEIKANRSYACWNRYGIIDRRP